MPNSLIVLVDGLYRRSWNWNTYNFSLFLSWLNPCCCCCCSYFFFLLVTFMALLSSRLGLRPSIDYEAISSNWWEIYRPTVQLAVSSFYFSFFRSLWAFRFFWLSSDGASMGVKRRPWWFIFYFFEGWAVSICPSFFLFLLLLRGCCCCCCCTWVISWHAIGDTRRRRWKIP